MRKERLDTTEPFVTKDGSEIRELAGTPTGNSVNQSLAEATVPPGADTEEHFHRVSEEIYLFTSGSGRMNWATRGRGVGRRHGRHPARPASQALEHGHRAPEAPVLLRTAVFARGHLLRLGSRVLHFLKCWIRASITGLAGASTATSSRRSANAPGRVAAA